ncbi:hypothetical protein D9M71_833840 [compost metagenome]
MFPGTGTRFQPGRHRKADPGRPGFADQQIEGPGQCGRPGMRRCLSRMFAKVLQRAQQFCLKPVEIQAPAFAQRRLQAT